MAIAAAAWRGKPGRALAIALGAIALCWPALWAGYPMLDPDSITYLASGRRVILILLGDHTLSNDYLRSVLYCAVIYLLHWNVSPWPVPAMNALLVSWTMWLTVRSVVPRRPVAVYLGLAAVVSVLSTASWCVVRVSPDVFTGVLCLCFSLLVFARQTLQRWESVVVAVVSVWGVTTHPTYIVLFAGLCGLLALLWLLHWPPLRGRAAAILQAAGILLLAAAAMAGADASVFGRPSLNGPQPPYLLARLLADAPAHEYLHQHCGQLHWVLCRSQPTLPWSDSEFLWAPEGVYQSASPQDKQELAAEEMPLVLGTLRAYPLWQTRRSAGHFIEQLLSFAVDDPAPYNPWMVSMLDAVLPASRERFLRAYPAQNSLHTPLLQAVQKAGVALSAVVVIVLSGWLWRRSREPQHGRLAGLAVAVVFVVLANAMLTGVLAGLTARYEGRVIWLLPMLACLLVVHWRRRQQA